MKRRFPSFAVAAMLVLAAPVAALEGGFDCAEGVDGEVEPYLWTGEAWVPNPAYPATVPGS